MNILTNTSQSSSFICKQWLHDKSIECNGTYTSQRKQWIDSKTSRAREKYDTPNCYVQKVSSNVKIIVAKIPLENRSMLSRNFYYYYCFENDCNRQEITERVEKLLNKKF